MKKKPYKRKPGEFEMRILRDGRLVVVTPDDGIMDVVAAMDPDNPIVTQRREGKENVQRNPR